METTNNLESARRWALISGGVGLLAGLVLLAFFALAASWLGRINDALGVVQFGALGPVVWALGRRLPATRSVRMVTIVAVVAAIAAAVLGLLLAVGALTFEQQIGPFLATIIVLYGWLLMINLTGHRTRTLPRIITRVGVLVATGFLAAMVLVGAGFVLPGPIGQITQYLGYGIAVLGWLGLPVYVLLLAARVFTPVPAPQSSRQPVGGSAR